MFTNRNRKNAGLNAQIERRKRLLSILPAQFEFLCSGFDKKSRLCSCGGYRFTLKSSHVSRVFDRSSHTESTPNEKRGLGKRRYSVKLWKTFQDVFNCMPVAALIDNKIFCCHGGLSPTLRSLDQLKRIQRPCDVQETG